MSTLTAFFRKLHLDRVLLVFLAGLVLLVTTACNSGNAVGARPNNLPVQMGGSNNPHKGGGDGYGEYKMTTDPSAVKKGKNDHASLTSGLLVAAVNSNASDLLYPSSEATDTNSPAIGTVGEEGKQKFFDAKKIPAERQPVLDRSDPDVKILEKSGQAFKDASGFLQDAGESAATGFEETNK